MFCHGIHFIRVYPIFIVKEENTLKFIIYLIAFVYLILTLCFVKKVKLDAKSMCIIGLVTAMSLVLRTIRIPLPTGSSIALMAVLPQMLLALTYSSELGIISGLLTGILSVILVPGYGLVHPMQLFVEHLPALSVLGYAGILGCDKKINVILASLFAIVLNVVFHTFSGALFFGEYAPSGMGPWVYSITYNLSGHGVEGIIAIGLISIMPLKKIKKILGGKNNVIYEGSNK